MTPGILGIVGHTPTWVFALFAVLVALGIQALRPRNVAVWRLLIVPAVFIAWGAASLALRLAAAPGLAVDWLAAVALGFAIGWLTTRLEGMAADRAAGRVQMPGSAAPLLRNLAIFLAKYALAAAAAISPGLAGALAPWDIAVSGLGAGYFAGWLVRFALAYRGRRAAPAG